MATRQRPQAVTHGDIFLSMILDELEEQGRTLAAIRDRLPAPTTGAGQPAQDAGEDTTDAEPAPAAPRKRPGPAKKTAAKTS